MRVVALTAVAAVLVTLMACAEDNPCDRYIDYMCACHADEEGFDCQALEDTYASADAEVQDQCSLELQDQKDVDKDAGLECSP